jgi:putative addiction module component (TIGR02574 family)
MTIKTKQLATLALCLSPKERATLADTLILSLDCPDPKIDNLWKIEVESRLKAYKAGKIKAVPLSKVLLNYKNKKAA